MKLNSIDNMRVDGKFVVGKDIPEGQGSVIGLLSECYDLAYELRSAAEAEEDEDEEMPDRDDDTEVNPAPQVHVSQPQVEVQ